MARSTLKETLQKEPFTLALSSGFFGFYAHLGLLKALLDQQLRPAKVTGSSAGALVGGLWAMGVGIDDLVLALRQLRRQDFWDPAMGLGLLRGGKFKGILQDLLPAVDLEDAIVPVAVSVCELPGLRSHAFSKGPAADLIRASCALPGMFHPVRVNNRYFVDGGLKDHTGLQGATGEQQILYHHLLPHPVLPQNKVMSFEIPHRPRLRQVALRGLPLVHPFGLQKGNHAFAVAYDMTARLLEEP